MLDYRDTLNSIDHPNMNIDRHDCVNLDVNLDGSIDLVCLVGADKGEGVGYNELYLTRGNGSLHKVKRHGLQKFPGMRTRNAAKLKHEATGSYLIFVGTTGYRRDDGRSNVHRMFRHLQTGKPPYFVHVPGPWEKNFAVAATLVADVNNDGLDE